LKQQKTGKGRDKLPRGKEKSSIHEWLLDVSALGAACGAS